MISYNIARSADPLTTPDWGSVARPTGDSCVVDEVDIAVRRGLQSSSRLFPAASSANTNTWYNGNSQFAQFEDSDRRKEGVKPLATCWPMVVGHHTAREP